MKSPQKVFVRCAIAAVLLAAGSQAMADEAWDLKRIDQCRKLQSLSDTLVRIGGAPETWAFVIERLEYWKC